MTFIKVEIIEHPENKYNSIIVTPKDSDPETLHQMDLILHAITTQTPKRGGYQIGSNVLKIDVLTENLISQIE